MIEEVCDPQVAADFLRAFAHPARLRILCRLLRGELAVAGFETELGLKQPSLSQQLGQLREAGLVTTRREAKSVVYQLADDRVAGVLEALHAAFASEPASPSAPPPPAPPTTATAPTAPTGPRAARPAGCGMFAVTGWSARSGTSERG